MLIKKKFTWLTSCLLLLTIPLPVRAFDLTFNAGASVGAYNDVDPSSTINTTNVPDGFGDYDGSTNDFFDSPFVVLGSDPNKVISDSSNLINVDPVNTIVFDGLNITDANKDKDIVIEFDWIFQGNQEDVLNFDLDTFSVAVVGTGANPFTVDVDLGGDLLITNEYSYRRNNQFTIEAGRLPVNNYTIQATLIEAPDVVGLVTRNDNSAVGIGNISATAVPFEFSPTLGLLMVSMFGGVSHFWKRRKSSQYDDQSLNNEH